MRDPLEKTEDRGAHPVVAFGQFGIGAIGGEQELGKVVGPDREERQPGQHQIERFRQSGHFEHGTKADLFGQPLAAVLEPGELFVEYFLGGIEFPWLADHREHDVERAPRRGFEQRARLRLEQPAAFERQA